MKARLAGAAAAVSWIAFVLRWFDVGKTFAPAWLESVPAWLLGLGFVGSAVVWVVARRRLILGDPIGAHRAGLLLVVGAAVLFRLPLAWWGAMGYTTPDGALSGTVAQRLRDGAEHFVFVPGVPYSGSLKSHAAAVLATVIDLPRAFTLASVAFYALFAAGLYRLALLSAPATAAAQTAAVAGLYAAFAPPFVTRYSLSNDGNYVEVLALGTWAMVFAARHLRGEHDHRLGLLVGLALGAAFWCHLLAVIYAAALAPFLVLGERRVRTFASAAVGYALGAWPALVWNAANGGESFLYLMPGGRSVGTLSEGPGAWDRLRGIVTDHWLVLLGYDPGYPPFVDGVLKGLAGLALLCLGGALGGALRRAFRDRNPALCLVLSLMAVNLVVAVAGLPYIPGNPRYLLFLVTAIALLLAAWATDARRRAVLAAVIAGGAAASLAQWPATARSDDRWRVFAADLARRGVAHCYTDFNLSAKLHLVSEGGITCSSALGPTTTEYFRDDAARVDAAPSAALVAVNTTAAAKLERRLARVGVTWTRDDLMKPVLHGLSRKVHPRELFPSGSDQLDSESESTSR